MSPSVPIAAFAGGLASSFGPCAAPRFLAAASLCAGSSGARRSLLLAAFAAGLFVSYVLACTAGNALARLSAISPYAYAVVGACSIASGTKNLFRAHRCPTRRTPTRSFGLAFLSGAAFVGIASPCCGPLAIAVSMQAGAVTLALPAAFALGHALPLAGLAIGAQRFERLLHLWPGYATQTVAGALAIAVGAYYWLLA